MTSNHPTLRELCMPLFQNPTDDWAPVAIDGEEHIVSELLTSPGDATMLSVATFIRLGYIRYDPRAATYMAMLPEGGWHLPAEGLPCSMCKDSRAVACKAECNGLTKRVKMLKADLAVQTAALVRAKEEATEARRQVKAYEQALTQLQTENERERGRVVKALCLAKRYRRVLNGGLGHEATQGPGHPNCSPMSGEATSVGPDATGHHDDVQPTGLRESALDESTRAEMVPAITFPATAQLLPGDTRTPHLKPVAPTRSTPLVAHHGDDIIDSEPLTGPRKSYEVPPAHCAQAVMESVPLTQSVAELTPDSGGANYCASPSDVSSAGAPPLTEDVIVKSGSDGYQDAAACDTPAVQAAKASSVSRRAAPQKPKFLPGLASSFRGSSGIFEPRRSRKSGG